MSRVWHDAPNREWGRKAREWYRKGRKEEDRDSGHEQINDMQEEEK